MLEALALLGPRRDKVRLLAIGDGNEVVLRELNRPRYVDELKEDAARLGVDHRVRWTGYYPSESDQASRYLRSVDACVLPFDSGVLLNNSSVAAAAAHSLPIVTTRGETVASMFKDGENLLFVPPKDPTALSAALESVIDDSALRRRLGTGAENLAREWFSWDRALERTVDAFTAR